MPPAVFRLHLLPDLRALEVQGVGPLSSSSEFQTHRLPFLSAAFTVPLTSVHSPADGMGQVPLALVSQDSPFLVTSPIPSTAAPPSLSRSWFLEGGSPSALRPEPSLAKSRLIDLNGELGGSLTALGSSDTPAGSGNIGRLGLVTEAPGVSPRSRGSQGAPPEDLQAQ